MTVLARLYNTTLRLGHWPSPFRRARVVVLPKPGKNQEQLRFTGGWRPIALLSCLGKPLEKIMARRNRILDGAGLGAWPAFYQTNNLVIARSNPPRRQSSWWYTVSVRTAWKAKGR